MLALSMLVARRSTEKVVTSNISSLAIAWLQQAFALPFIIITLFFARFYWPSELSAFFWTTMSLYVVLLAVDIFCYFKALSLADVSYIAPIMTLVAVGNVVGAYIVLGQKPSIYGLVGAAMIVAGASFVYRAKRKDADNHHTNKIAMLLILLLVVVRSFNSNIEVSMIREANATTFNFYSSILTVPFIFFVSLFIIHSNKTDKYKNYWRGVQQGVQKHRWMLWFIGLTYTINMLATYSAKLISPNAGYVGAVKSASVLPMVLVGLFFFREKVVPQQWFGLVLIMGGLTLLAFN